MINHSQAFAGSASAHRTELRIYAGPPQPYYPALVRVRPYYAPAPVYYRYREVYLDPRWQERRAWRHHHWHPRCHGYRHHDRGDWDD
jgi:hypothetical protein